MKITVVGAGAMGSIFGGLLADAGNTVTLVDLWQDHIDAIREHGLRVEGASGDRIIKWESGRPLAPSRHLCITTAWC